MPEQFNGKVCIIGAGCSGFTTAKRFKEFGIDYDHFEASDDIGGNWYHKNPNGMSACYQSLHIDTSKHRLAFEDYPVPDNWPDFPHHSQMLAYFNDYVDHFDLRRRITFNTYVEDARRDDANQWHVSLSTGEKRVYDALVVANGHHWDSKIPTEYGHRFNGIQMHSHAYDSPFEPHDLRGKNVLVVGVGNSAMDIASEVSQKPIAAKCFVSARRGVWVLPKYLNGEPADKAVMPAWVPRDCPLAWPACCFARNWKYGKLRLTPPRSQGVNGASFCFGRISDPMGCGDISVKPVWSVWTATALFLLTAHAKRLMSSSGRQAIASVFHFSNKMDWLS